MNNNTSSVPGRVNDPKTFAKFASVKSFQDFLKDKDNPVVMITLSLKGEGFLDRATFSLQLSQHTNAHDEFTIVVNDTAIDDFTGQVMKNSKDLLGENITIHFHHHGSIVQSFKGIIANIRNRKDEGGGHGRLYISGYAPSIILENGKDCQSYENKTLPEIIAEATTEYPQEAKVNTEGMINTKYKIPYAVQYKESDYRFISRLARRYGEFFYYNGTQLIFSNEAQNTVELFEGDDMIDVEFELMIKPQNFTYLSYDAETAGTEQKKTQEVHLQDKVNPFQFAAIKASNKVFTKVPEMPYVAIPEQFRGDYLKDVVRREKESREQLMQVRGKSRNPHVRIGGFVKLKDINGKPMETYRVIDIKHYQSGQDYYNEFIAIPDVYIAYYYDEEALPRAEQQIARVTDNNDPKGLGRVRVQFIWQEKYKTQTPWIRVVQPHAGADKGFYFIPEIGEEVLVDFEDQNAERPYVIGSNYNGKEYSPFHNTNNDIKAIQTRSGVKIKINDAEGSVYLEDKGGNKVLLDGNGNIKLSSLTSVSIDSKEINLKSDTLNIETTQLLKAKSQQNFILSSLQRIDIEETKNFNVNVTNVAMSAHQNIKTTAQQVQLGAEKQMIVASENMELHGTQAMALKSPKMDKVTKAKKVSQNDENKEGVQVIATIKPRDYKGEYGIDYCEMDSNFENIKTFQGTDVKKIDYIFDKNTNQFKSATSFAEKQAAIKEQYYSTTLFGKEYYASWILLPKGKTAKLTLTTFFISKKKKVDKPKGGEMAKEFLCFSENTNFLIKGKGVTNGGIIELKKHEKEYDIEIESLNTFSDTQYIKIEDEEGNIAGIIEMAPNETKKLGIKLVPVVVSYRNLKLLKETNLQEYLNEIERLKEKGKDLYKKIDTKKLLDELNTHSLSQAGIECFLPPIKKDPNKEMIIDSLIVDINNEYKNYWDNKSISFKERELTEEERKKSNHIRCGNPFVYIDEDGIEHFNSYEDGVLKEKKMFFLNKLRKDYLNTYSDSLKDITIFVTDEKYDISEKTAAYTFNNPLRYYSIIVFQESILNYSTYAHEMGHLLGLEHTFFKNVEEVNDTNNAIFLDSKAFEEYDEELNKNRKYLSNLEDSAKRLEEYIKESESIINNPNSSESQKKQHENYLKDNRNDICQNSEKRKMISTFINIDEKNRQVFKERISIRKGQGFRIVEGETKNYMDYVKEKKNREYYNKSQCLKMRDEIKKYHEENENK